MQGNTCRILVVDDDDLLRDALQAWFGDFCNCPTFTAADAGEAFAHLRETSFDVVITGIHQPGMDGLEMAERIRESGGPPVIIWTGDDSAESRREARRVGAKAFLKKPTQFEVVLEVVLKVVGEGCCLLDERD